MKWTLVLILPLSLCAYGQEEAICSFSEEESEYFNFTESFPFKDIDFAPESTIEALKRMEDFMSGEEVSYFIPQNTLNIISGGYLQKEILEAKFKYNNYTPPESGSWDRAQYNLKLEYENARKEYCDFQRTHLSIDW